VAHFANLKYLAALAVVAFEGDVAVIVTSMWHWDRFFPEYFGFPCQFHSTGAPLLGKMEKN
jgi:hypothetical protein